MSKRFTSRSAFDIPASNKISQIINEIEQKFNGRIIFCLLTSRALTSDAKLINQDDGDKQLIETLSVYLPKLR